MDVLIFIIAVIIVLAILTAAANSLAAKQRRDQLFKKYNNEKIVERILAKEIWQGMTKEQLKDSWGKPVDIDIKVYKEKATDVFKYDHVSGDRYRRRVTIENGEVVGWELK